MGSVVCVGVGMGVFDESLFIFSFELCNYVCVWLYWKCDSNYLHLMFVLSCLYLTLTDLAGSGGVIAVC